jgi:two-component sensor histidine kinase
MPPGTQEDRRFGFPTGTARQELVELVVADNGIGIADSSAAGMGAGSVEGLCQVIGASTERTSHERGGTSVSVRFSVD